MKPAQRRDGRRSGIVLTVALVLLGGALLHRLGGPSMAAAPAAVPGLQQQFDLAVQMLQERRYAQALGALHRVLALAPELPEAHVNLGFTLLGLQRPDAARASFDNAINLLPTQANAYYGLGLAYEALGDVPMATGAMRSYLHLARNEDPAHLRRARAALWEWEAQRAAIPASGNAVSALGPRR